jgi:hypothetical protein
MPILKCRTTLILAIETTIYILQSRNNKPASFMP